MGDAANIAMARINADAMVNAANIGANASMYGANATTGASRYNTDTDRTTEEARIAQARDAAQLQANTQRYGYDTQAQTQRDVARMGNSLLPQDQLVNSSSGTRPAGGASNTSFGQPFGNRTASSDPLAGSRIGDTNALNRFSQGTPRVPGHGDGTVDTVDAKLAPGEAVLNKAAAEMLGRGLIDLLNKHGMLQMGMPEPDEDDMTQGEPQHHAAGCSSVRKYAAGTSNVGFKTSQDERAAVNGGGSSGWGGAEFSAGRAEDSSPSQGAAGLAGQTPAGPGGGRTPSFDYAGAARSLRSR